MKNIKRVAILSGGISAEREIALRSAAAVEKALTELGYELLLFDLNRETIPQFLQELYRFAPDVVFIALHGPFGEDGTVQGLLEIVGIPYTGSGVLASALAMDKAKAKEIFAQHHILTPPWVSLNSHSTFAPIFNLGNDVVIKPVNQGSTIGVSVLHCIEELPEAVAKARHYSAEILVEKYIPGREITCGILGDEVLEVVEIIPKGGFYDYQHKYTVGMTEYQAPAQIPSSLRQRIRQTAFQAHCALRCSGATRVDMRLSPDEDVYVLEVNTIPGMTELSLLPKSAFPCGYDFPSLIQRMLELALQPKL